MSPRLLRPMPARCEVCGFAAPLRWLPVGEVWCCGDSLACLDRERRRRADEDSEEEQERRFEAWAEEDERHAREHDEREVWEGKGRRYTS